ncbi:prolipoprotein diacylglyceryl transferase [Saccharopolyspora erythraea NRRL 2338]|uniref:Phosphatidylglycerol--prolipoprotein diacylglyceryl transferase n=2 Tax=Saccharopolyspora erythraea TaxID=1836 RepID=A4FLK6_SACEN|nr:prolipoprotein diacylglyceryl transferase [Saccharopolyspora erythraea]EQD82978.1 diacylglyceryl transferase [Saccharopolyspora erythraea D]PFG98571.1 prolipoprotein diacylglyceryl transferase [Saccharopolyspora erythraea NRRL 2338]QRK88610.1 prolipoprotein diacylglyceryl transferase [Saccharopolyspora erythraea]CAM04931.1 prolipoprotein diacylglyceryl transferase [Saccharopolyspora erythraea NRRL 2338]
MTAPVPASATAFLANIPSPDQGVWYVGPFPLRAYALCIIAGIVVAILWGDRRWVARGGRKGTVVDIAVFAVPFGLVGGRLYHVATDWHKYFGPDRNPLDALKVWEGGLGIWGAVALGAVGAWIGCRRRGVPLPAFADAVAPGLVLAQAIGRLGNWFNQELYGGPTTLPWGLEIYRRIDPATGLSDPIAGVAADHNPIAVVHPTFLYELLWNVGVCLLIVWADRQFRMGRGRVFALYVAGYTAGRFWIELMRTDEATPLFGIRINVFTSVLVFALAVVYLLVVRGKREDPARLLGKPRPGEEDEPEARSDDAAASEETAGGEAADGERRAGGADAAEAEAQRDRPEAGSGQPEAEAQRANGDGESRS